MAHTITHITAEKMQNNVDTANKHTFHKTNFNMPIEDLWSDVSNWVRFNGPINYTGTATSFNLSDFVPGYEVWATSAIYDIDNTGGGSDYNYNFNAYHKFYDTDGTTILFTGVNGANFSGTLTAGSWWEQQYAYHQGVAGWEIDTSSTFYTKAWTTGTPAIGVTTQNITFTNVPSVAQLGSNLAGYIWVEGNNLCFVNANRWKHTMVGTQVSTTPGASNAGYIWIDGSDLHWVGNNGYDYKVAWKIKQFASEWGNSSTGAINAGTANAGYIWVDSEFGWTHLSYIGSDGYKYLTGAGVDPYT